MKKYSYIIILLFIFIGLFVSCDTGNSTQSKNSTKRIGVTLPITGDSPLDITAHQALIKLAQDDINEYFKDNLANITFETNIKDTENSPIGIMNALESFERNNLQYVASAGISQNLLEAEYSIKSFDGLMIHSTSTVPLLSNNDNLYRIIPNDIVNAIKISEKINDDGIKKVIIFHRNDIWGTELTNKLNENLSEFGIDVFSFNYEVRFLPHCLNDPILLMEQKCEALTEQNSKDEIALVVLSFNEISNILNIADKNKILLGINWYGSDGLITNDFLVNDSKIAAIAEKVNLYCPAISERESDIFQSIKSTITNQLGYTPRANNFLIYDAIWLAALAMAENIENPEHALEKAVSKGNFICGDIQFDENGDRKSAHYEYWHVVKFGEYYKWEKSN
ncbi:MAG: hypothetical protein ACLFQM_08490 [Fidelibacterota bacterium]